MASTPSSRPIYGHDLVEHLALDHRVAAILHEVGDEQVSDALADIHVPAKDCIDGGMNRGVIEIQDGHARLATGAGGGRLRGDARSGDHTHERGRADDRRDPSHVSPWCVDTRNLTSRSVECQRLKGPKRTPAQAFALDWPARRDG